jgi:DNA polymerase-3 subunit delta'
MNWDSIRGHGELVNWFRRTIRRGRLSQGYVFAGPEGIGKRLFARTLAQCLLCQRHSNEELLACGECNSCKMILRGQEGSDASADSVDDDGKPSKKKKAQSHPDLHEVGRLKGKSELTLEVFLGPPENRGREGLCFDLSLRPMAADRKIAIIDDASLMNDESANAFLKTLEEPQPRALILLIADNLDALLPTIRSRCQTVRFDPLPSHDVAELLVRLEMISDPAEATALAELSGGSLAVAAQLLEPTLRELRDAMYQQLAGEFNSFTLAEKLNAGIETIGGDATAQRRNARWLIRFGLEFFRTAALHLSDRPEGTVIPAAVSFARRFDARSPEDFEFVMSLFERVAETERHIDSNVSVPRCLEVLCEDLGRKLRPARR